MFSTGVKYVHLLPSAFPFYLCPTPLFQPLPPSSQCPFCPPSFLFFVRITHFSCFCLIYSPCQVLQVVVFLSSHTHTPFLPFFKVVYLFFAPGQNNNSLLTSISPASFSFQLCSSLFFPSILSPLIRSFCLEREEFS